MARRSAADAEYGEMSDTSVCGLMRLFVMMVSVYIPLSELISGEAAVECAPSEVVCLQLLVNANNFNLQLPLARLSHTPDPGLEGGGLVGSGGGVRRGGAYTHATPGPHPSTCNFYLHQIRAPMGMAMGKTCPDSSPGGRHKIHQLQ